STARQFLPEPEERSVAPPDSRERLSPRANVTTAASRTPPWRLSGWEFRDRHLSTMRRNPDKPREHRDCPRPKPAPSLTVDVPRHRSARFRRPQDDPRFSEFRLPPLSPGVP